MIHFDFILDDFKEYVLVALSFFLDSPFAPFPFSMPQQDGTGMSSWVSKMKKK